MLDYEKRIYKRVKGLLSVAKLINPIAANPVLQFVTFNLMGILAGKPFVNKLLQALTYKKQPILALLNPFFYRSLRQH